MRGNKQFITLITTVLLITMLFTSCSSKESGGTKQTEIIQDNMFVDDVLLANTNGRWCLINKHGEELANYRYIDPNYSEGLLMVEEDDKYGYIDSTGKVVISLQYDNAGIFTEGLGAVYVNGHWGFIDKANKMVIMPVYDRVDSFLNGLCAVSKDGIYSYIDAKGKKAFEGEFLYAEPFVHGSAAVEMEEGMALINTAGEIISETFFDEISYDDLPTLVNHGLAMITIDDRYGYIDLKTGDVILYPMYYEVSGYENGICAIYQDGGYGLADAKGNIIVKPQYNNMKILRDGTAIAFDEDSNMKFFDKTGEEIDASKIKDGYLSWRSVEEFSPKKEVLNLSGDVILEIEALGAIRRLRNNEYAYITADQTTTAEPLYTTTIIDNKGKEILKINGMYGGVSPVSENQYAFFDNYNNWAIVDKKGNKKEFSNIDIIKRDNINSVTIKFKNQFNHWDNSDEAYTFRYVNFFTDDGYALFGLLSDDNNATITKDTDEKTSNSIKIGVGVINTDGEIILPDEYNTICSLTDMDTLTALLQDKE